MTRSVLLASVFVFACFAETSPAAAANVALLMPGSSGIVPGDFRVRNEGRFRGAGIRTIMTTSPSSAAEAVAAEIAQVTQLVLSDCWPACSRACRACRGAQDLSLVAKKLTRKGEEPWHDRA
jgi:hypothetical protein